MAHLLYMVNVNNNSLQNTIYSVFRLDMNVNNRYYHIKRKVLDNLIIYSKAEGEAAL